jgi:hypothetical protein
MLHVFLQIELNLWPRNKKTTDNLGQREYYGGREKNCSLIFVREKHWPRLAVLISRLKNTVD